MKTMTLKTALYALEFASDSYVRLAKMIVQQMETGEHDQLKLLKFIAECNRRLAADVITMRRLFEEEEP